MSSSTIDSVRAIRDVLSVLEKLRLKSITSHHGIELGDGGNENDLEKIKVFQYVNVPRCLAFSSYINISDVISIFYSN